MSPQRCILRALLGALMSGAALAAAADMPSTDLTAGFYRIKAEVALNQADRMQGLMQRTQLGPNQGMLFSFPLAARHCMWMKNTLIPLSVAFLDSAGRIINISDMQPQTENSHCADKEASFALEMNLGWFAAKGIKAGAAIGGVDRLPPPR